ncbi:type II toxin-antitoxin system HicB family antitoxin [Pseudomonas sp. NPDC089996]|uniref:type II toxin-antitoxin system HicB family antitoxin n=1 Tax=Pseudomonas sp. NPDC089996 TaxID=3364474 RepID=UPI00380E819F
MKISVVLHKDTHSDYGVTVPNVPGCFSAGASVAKALANVREALALHFEGLIADEDVLPQVQDVDVHRANPDYADGFWAVVDCTDFARLYGGSTPR